VIVKVLITGVNGMVGKNLAERLAANKGIELLVPRRYDLDLLEQRAVKAYMLDNRPDFVFHLAAKVGGIQANISNPVGFFVDNMLMSTHVIMSAVEAGVEQLINLGSSCMYPRNREVLCEADILTGELEPTNEGYALAKISATQLCRYISDSKKLYYKTVVPCNLYGRYDHFDDNRSHMVPAVIRKMYEAKKENMSKVSIWGDGESRREFMYVDDLVDFLLLAMADIKRLPSIVNAGLGFDYSIDDYYQIAAAIVGYKGGFSHDTSKPSGMKKKMLNVSVSNELGWKAKIPLEDGMKKLYRYYLNEVIND